VSEVRRPTRPAPVAAPAPTPAPTTVRPPEREDLPKPFLLDFLPLESEKETRLARFFARLAEGRLSTTRCSTDGRLMWPPRTACPYCHSEALDWVDLPTDGRLYAFSAVLAGAPLGMEAEVPFAVGLVDLDGVPLRLFGRIEGKSWEALRIGAKVRVEPYSTPDGRWFYRFRAAE
jgi:uncharacterized OB-fold protein